MDLHAGTYVPQQLLDNCQLLGVLNNQIPAMEQGRGAGSGCSIVAGTSRHIHSNNGYCSSPLWPVSSSKSFSGETYSYQVPFGKMSNFFCYILWLIL